MAGCFVVATGIFFTLSPASQRLYTLDALEVVYGCFDPWTDTTPPKLGPEIDDPTAWSQNWNFLASRLEKSERFSETKIPIDHDQSINRESLKFLHKNTNHPSFRRFERQLRKVIPGEPSIFELSSDIRKLAVHGTANQPFEDDPLEILGVACRGEELLCHNFAVLYGHADPIVGYTSQASHVRLQTQSPEILCLVQ